MIHHLENIFYLLIHSPFLSPSTQHSIFSLLRLIRLSLPWLLPSISLSFAASLSTLSVIRPSPHGDDSCNSRTFCKQSFLSLRITSKVAIWPFLLNSVCLLTVMWAAGSHTIHLQATPKNA